MDDLWITFLRTLFFYFAILVVIRLMGKREVGQLSPFDLVVSIMIAEAAIVPIEDTQKPIMSGLLPILTLTALQMLISILCLKLPALQALINGRPTVVIEDGKINEENMRHARYTIYDLMEQLRLQQTPALNDVEYAILEMSGKLSVLPKANSRALQPSDMGMDLPKEGLPALLVVDGTINDQGLQSVGQDKEWLKTRLQKLGVTDIGDLLVAALDRSGNLFVQHKTHQRNFWELFQS